MQVATQDCACSTDTLHFPQPFSLLLLMYSLFCSLVSAGSFRSSWQPHCCKTNPTSWECSQLRTARICTDIHINIQTQPYERIKTRKHICTTHKHTKPYAQEGSEDPMSAPREFSVETARPCCHPLMGIFFLGRGSIAQKLLSVHLA